MIDVNVVKGFGEIKLMMIYIREDVYSLFWEKLINFCLEKENIYN